jgi:hypothetical protein
MVCQYDEQLDVMGPGSVDETIHFATGQPSITRRRLWGHLDIGGLGDPLLMDSPR